MPLSKVKHARKLNDEELAEAILEAKRKLFDLRMQQATRQLEKPHEFKHTRHWIAQLLTVERERELAAQNNQASKTAPAAETATDTATEEE
ncbi:50S ribosomal protein L29 [Spirulina sp. CS-785/01]|uniref:50S ribosomal protein L29 n=1 Tax=Spirulina sp. CS-785/01 TaxID=3021716 RepID=UPI00232D9366|nr:50S ribosomal protein L29 [Spirulina sp. CS-785/01]MDB9312278.1 50S ribosomal protein L29 [Spirulina sp. CS-785/01]